MSSTTSSATMLPTSAQRRATAPSQSANATPAAWVATSAKSTVTNATTGPAATLRHVASSEAPGSAEGVTPRAEPFTRWKYRVGTATSRAAGRRP